jgi:hypothetical protein
MDTFTLLTGLVTLAGFTIQVFNLFPRLGRARQVVFLLTVGVFVGSLLRAIDPASVRIAISISGFTVIVSLFVLVIVGFLTAAAFTADAKKRGEFYGISSIGFFVFIFVLIFGGVTSQTGESTSVEKQRITITEFNLLVERALQTKDLDRALMHLHTMERRLSHDEERAKAIRERIRQIELQELK